MHKELPDNIRAVYAGRKVMAPEAAAQVAEHSGEETLTPKELEVLRLIAAGNANKEIGVHLSISEESVKSRVKNILDKLGARDRTHAVTVGLKRGIIEL
jgi:DNA-binding NarL/FixJ family response regulator